jgi:hypothetical protein
MAATRFSGNVKITVHLCDEDFDGNKLGDKTTYRVVLSMLTRKQVETVRHLSLSPDAARRMAVDSSEAFDAIASSAISFATCEDFANEACIAKEGENDGGVYLIARSRAKAWGSKAVIA